MTPSFRSGIRVEAKERVLIITIDRPEVMNAMHPDAHLEMSRALDRFESDDELWLCVLTGAGDKAFSAGRDLKQLAFSQAAGKAFRKVEVETVARTRRLTARFDLVKPIIARVNGLALGGGLELALACDVIIAADHAEFGLPEVRRGMIAAGGGVHRLSRQIGLKAAMGYMLTGRRLTAFRAYELGLVNEVVPMAELDEVVLSWIEDMLAGAPLALRATKQSALMGMDMSLEEAIGADFPAELCRRASSDAIEGPKAFAERRMPVWRAC